MKMNKLTCPKCKGENYIIMCLTSDPPKFEYECRECRWSLRYFDRDDSYLPITQLELNFKFEHNK